MARPATRKFERPPTFGGLGEEDVVDWQARYEKVGKYNGWTDGDMAGNLPIYLTGSAEKWWDSLVVEPTAWADTQRMVTRGGVDVQETVAQAKTQLLRAFKKGNYAQFQEGKLRSRKQGHGESALDYYYDVIALCKAADPKMGEQAKVNYLMEGLSAELTTKMYVMKINSSDKFREAVILEYEAQALVKAWRAEQAELLATMTGEGSAEVDAGEEDLGRQLDYAIDALIRERDNLRGQVGCDEDGRDSRAEPQDPDQSE